jgi:hypothetical protein
MTGLLPHPYFMEGTHEGGFPRLISFSSPHIISEARWLRDPVYVFGQVRNHCLTADPKEHYFTSSRIDKSGGDYNNWIVKSAWEAFWVHPDMEFMKEVIPSLAGDVLGTLRVFDADEDWLPVPAKHWNTGMEFQPSFFYFNENYDNSKPGARMERGEFAAYAYGNARAVAAVYRMLGIADQAERFDGIAGNIQRACLEKLWDDADRFIYGIRESDDQVARVREIVGFYPFVPRLVPDEPRYTAMFAYLVDPEEFWVAYPPATCSRQCPAYTSEISTWPAAGGVTHGSMWNGPHWPHATSVMLDVAAAAVQDYTQRYVRPEHFWHLFDRYTHIQFENDDLSRPMTREYYNNTTTLPEGVPDYFHSTYCDLVIKYLVGVQPENSDDRIMIRPIPGPFKRFSLRNVRCRGHTLDVVYQGGAGTIGSPAGLTVWVDGRWAAHRGSLGELEIALPKRERPKKAPSPEVDIYGQEIR